jgi:hypothetical protein
MKRQTIAFIVATVALSFGSGACARTATPKNFVDEETRDIEGGRKVLVVSPQTTIGVNVAWRRMHMLFLPGDDVFGADDIPGREDIFGEANMFGAGKLPDGDPVRESVLRDAARSKALVAPLQGAIATYDFNGRLSAAIAPAIAKSSWLHGQDYEVSSDGTLVDIEAHLNASDTRQMYVVRAAYWLDVHDEDIVVELTPSILVRRIPKGQRHEVRLKADYIPYRQIYRCLVNLPGAAGRRPEENVARWAADDGRLARRALDLAIDRVQSMFVENLDASREQVESWRRRGDLRTVDYRGKPVRILSRNGDAFRFVEARNGALNEVLTLAPE